MLSFLGQLPSFGFNSVFCVFVLRAFVVLRVADLTWRGQWAQFMTGDGYNWILALEFGLLLTPVAMLRRMGAGGSLGGLYRSALLIILGATLYRMGVVWLGFRPLGGAVYFPSLPEMAVTFGFIAVQVMGYLVIVKKFPILDARTRKAPGLGGTIGTALNQE